ncbi:MAG TPA: hypothetical protein VG737_10770 [Cyclobacteriaceae bacterium]|nr:hypothetical protein [Cyclobacteriaceae bacterium]
MFFVIAGCSHLPTRNQVEGHWHSLDTENSEISTIDIKDSTIVSDKYAIGSFPVYLKYPDDARVEVIGDQLTLEYQDTSIYFFRSDLKKCIISDRYRNCMIDLSLPEVDFAKPFEISKTDFSTGDLIIGKLNQETTDPAGPVANNPPDSIFIQTNDVLIRYEDIPGFVRQLQDCFDCPKPNINLHIDQNVPREIEATVLSLINPEGSFPMMIHYVVKRKNGDIGLIRRRSSYATHPDQRHYSPTE